MLVETLFMVTQVSNFWMLDAVIIRLFSTIFTLEVNLLILLFHWNALTYVFAGVIFYKCTVWQVQLHYYTIYLLIIHYLHKANLCHACCYIQCICEDKNCVDRVICFCMQFCVYSKCYTNEDGFCQSSR